MFSTKPMRVANGAFLLDRLAADTPPLQQIRELTQNALEAVNRRLAADNSNPGIIRWDVDWLHASHTGTFKLSVTDNGDGMTAEEMQNYLNNLAVQGASQSQAITGNFGVGAKITALYHNKAGLLYQSWKDGVGAMVELHRDDEEGTYGLKPFKLPDGITWSPKISDKAKPTIVSTSGTKVVLMGNDAAENTCVKPEGALGGATNWLYKYLNTRYFRLPDNVRIQVRNLKKDPTEWPKSEPPSSDKTYNFESISGMQAILDEHASEKGAVKLASARVLWWLFEDPKAVDRSVNPRALGPGHIGLVFQNEVYVARTGNAGRKLMAGFGILYGSEHVVLYVEPRESDATIHADTARSRLIIDGDDVDDAGLWDIWGQEFKEKMPAPIKAMMERLITQAESSDDGTKRQRILERLERIRHLLNPSRYRRDPNGQLRGANHVTGGEPDRNDAPRESDRNPSHRHRNGGSASDEYLADLIEEGGDPVVEVNTRREPPRVEWVSLENGLRREDELVDMAAEIQVSAVTGDCIKANADFRGFRDLINSFMAEFGAAGDEAILHKITEIMREWVETQLLEVVVTVRNMEDGKVWDKGRIATALAPEALTAAMMARYFIVEKLRRALGNELMKAPKGRPPQEVAAAQ